MSSTTAAYTVVVPGPHVMPALCGPRDVFLRQIERAFPGASIVVRGNEVHLEGPDAELAGGLIEELVLLLQRGQHLDEIGLTRAIDMIRQDERPSTVLTDDIMRGAKGRAVRPKTAGRSATSTPSART